MNPRLLSLTALLAFTTFSPAQQTGLTYERWNNLPGDSLEILRRGGINARLPDHTGTVTLAETPTNIGDNHGTRLRGQIIAPATGDYTFFIAGDDNVELWLAHDNTLDTTAPWNRRLIAWHRHFTTENQWNKYPTQRSETVRLVTGQSYYIEALAKENTGSDHLSIGWHRVEAGPLATTTWSPHSAIFTSQSNGTTDFTVASGDIWSGKDCGAFHQRSWTGDGVFTLEIGGLNNPHLWAKSGLMIRESNSENSRHTFLARRTGTNGVVFQQRLATGGISTHAAAASANNWNHLRLERIGDTITGSISPDGQSWTVIGTSTHTGLGQTIHVGFAASSNTSAGTPLTGWHGPLDARESSSSNPMPAPPALFGGHHWQPAGATWHSQPDGTLDFHLTSGDMWGTTDRASFHARTWSGDGQFITYLGEFEASDPWAKAGLMLRAHAGDSSLHASILKSYANGISFHRRASDGGSSAHTSVATEPAASHPWLRLIRSGTTVTAASSLDGRMWETRGSITFASLPNTVLVGYAVCAKSTTNPASGWFGALDARPLTATEVIPGTHLVPHIAHPDDPADAGLPEDWMLTHNLNPQNPFGDSGPYGDPDNDGLDNLTEYQNATDPKSPSPLVGVLTRELWTGIPGKTIHDLVSHARFHQDPNEISLVPGIDFAIPSINGLLFGARYRGSLVAPATGIYRFWISGDDNAELWLADGSVTPRGESSPRTDRFGKRRIAWIEDERFDNHWTRHFDFDHHPSQRSVAIHLQAGQPYFIEVLHKEGQLMSHVAVAWQPPLGNREIIPAENLRTTLPSPEDLDDDGLPDQWQNDNGLNDPTLTAFQRGQYGDPDGDGLTNLQEYQYGTNPRNADTDFDDLTDYNEIFHYGTDPLISNNLQNTPIPNQPSPQQYDPAATTGGWTANPDGTLSAWDRRGEITYTFTTTAPGIHEIILTGAAIGNIRPIERLPLVLSLNGNTIASTELLSENGQPGTVRTLTPLLGGSVESPVTHTLTILHDNYRTARRLRIDSIEINRLGGGDLGGISGIPDWAEQNSLAANALTRIPTTSRTSPLSIEGITQNLASTTLTYTPPGASEAIPPDLTPSINSTFFTDIPLSKSGPTTLTASFLGGILPPETHTITWLPTNLFEFDEGELHIRQHDSLLLDAWSGSAPDGQPFTITLDSVPLEDEAENATHSSGTPFAFEFETPGTHTLTATHADQSATLTLHVHAADFGPAPSVRAYSPRSWTPPLLAPSHLVETDERLTLAETTQFPLPLGEGQGEGAQHGPRSFRAAVHQAGNRHVIARLPHNVEGATSAILARGTVHGFYLAYLDETTDAEVIHQYDDGTWLMRGSMVAVNLPPDVLIRLTTIFQGTVFHNGADTLWLDHAFFDPNGISTIYYEWAGTGSPRLCNRLHLFLQP